jgi:hypothetical protein
MHITQVEVGKRSEGGERTQSLVTKFISTKVEVSKADEGCQCSCALNAHVDIVPISADTFVTQIEVGESSETRQCVCLLIAERSQNQMKVRNGSEGGKGSPTLLVVIKLL